MCRRPCFDLCRDADVAADDDASSDGVDVDDVVVVVDGFFDVSSPSRPIVGMSLEMNASFFPVAVTLFSRRRDSAETNVTIVFSSLSSLLVGTSPLFLSFCVDFSFFPSICVKIKINFSFSKLGTTEL